MANKGLGRGLSSLIPKKINISDYSDFNLDEKKGELIDVKSPITSVDPNKIVPNPYQPRKEFDPVSLNSLVESIKEHGIIQPLIISPEKNGSYELIAGERRWRSAIELNLPEVPVIIREIDNQEKLELALIENLQREDLNPIDSAVAYNQLINEFNLTQDDLAKKLGKPRSTITNTLRFLALPKEIKEALIKRQISEAHAKYLLGLDSELKQLTIFRKILYNNLSVRETDKLIKEYGGTKKAKVIIGDGDKAIIDSLQLSLGTKVEIKRGQKGGKIEIFFYSDEDLVGILKKIK
ncbi:MAG: ParB/RepB/Spo0J family partition protein [Patescibacteria group bacterium]|nr:ParB/RepB/Spo0J family partition protein [Patescibacteria group bacterium]